MFTAVDLVLLADERGWSGPPCISAAKPQVSGVNAECALAFKALVRADICVVS